MGEMQALNEKLNKFILLQKKQARFACKDEQFQVQNLGNNQFEETRYIHNQGAYISGFNNYGQQQIHYKPFVPYNQCQGFVPMQQFQGNYQQQQYAPSSLAQQQPTHKCTRCRHENYASSNTTRSIFWIYGFGDETCWDKHYGGFLL